MSCPASVSVIVVTRDRPRQLEVCLRAVLTSEFREFELIVVDQSESSSTSDMVDAFARGDSRVHLVRDHGRGAARARNIGAAAARGQLLVFTDDDCEPDPAWLGVMQGALRADPTAGLVYGSVLAAPHDPRDGFIVTHVPRRRRRFTGRLAKLRESGISANVAVRRGAFERTGGFDEMLGPGGYFPCAEDFDLAYRVLANDFSLLHEPDAVVVHHGLRDWPSGSALIVRTYVAIGAAYMKHVRLWDPVGALLLLQELMRAMANIARNVARRRGPFGLGRLRGLLAGAVRSFELGVEPGHMLYSQP